MEIIDLTKAGIEPKKIELLSCLQSSEHEKINVNYFFKTSGAHSLNNAESITRVCQNASRSGLDLIIVKKKHTEEVWLGNWNDGII